MCFLREVGEGEPWERRVVLVKMGSCCCYCISIGCIVRYLNTSSYHSTALSPIYMSVYQLGVACHWQGSSSIAQV